MAKTDIRGELEKAPPSVLVTGATGLVGSALCAALERSGISYRRALRHSGGSESGDSVPVGEVGSNTDWRAALHGISSVIHLAARTHVMREPTTDPLVAYRQVNVAGTQRLAEAAAGQGIKRFIFMSSIKVIGERTRVLPFRESDEPRPEDAYGVTKLEAEEQLRHIAAGTGMTVTVIRPPLVYGPWVKGNFLALMRAVHKGVPLPLASIKNARSLVYVENLVSAIINCLQDARAADKTFLVSDGEDVSTPQLIRQLAAALAVRPRLYRFPPLLLRAAAGVVGRRAQVTRLIESLQVDSTHIRRVLGWKPPFSVEQGLAETARWYVSNTPEK